MNNFTLNDCEEASISCSFDNETITDTILDIQSPIQEISAILT